MRSGLGQLLLQWGGAAFPPSTLCWPLITVRCFVLAPHLRSVAPSHPPLTGSTLPAPLSLALGQRCVFRKPLFSTLKTSLLAQILPTSRTPFTLFQPLTLVRPRSADCSAQVPRRPEDFATAPATALAAGLWRGAGLPGPDFRTPFLSRLQHRADGLGGLPPHPAIFQARQTELRPFPGARWFEICRL
jgi:hypothetical protein